MTERSTMYNKVHHYWMVTACGGREGGFTKTMSIGVVALDLISALNSVKEKHPDIKIVSANHRGPVDIISDI